MPKIGAMAVRFQRQRQLDDRMEKLAADLTAEAPSIKPDGARMFVGAAMHLMTMFGVPLSYETDDGSRVPIEELDAQEVANRLISRSVGNMAQKTLSDRASRDTEDRRGSARREPGEGG